LGWAGQSGCAGPFTEVWDLVALAPGALLRGEAADAVTFAAPTEPVRHRGDERKACRQLLAASLFKEGAREAH
jgi:hypothetical protein